MADTDPTAADASASNTEPSAPSVPPSRVLKDIVYCGVCSMPPEYCEFDAKLLPKCKAWLKENFDELYEQYYAADAAADKLKETSISDTPEGGDASGAPAEAAPAAPEPKKESKKDKKKKIPQVTIETVSRNKRKHMTTVMGLEAFDVDLKKAAKTFANKFACGSSVTKNAEGKDEIVVQGEFAFEIAEMLVDLFPNIPEEAVVVKEPKK